MARERPSPRRSSVNMPVVFTNALGNDIKFIVTMGYAVGNRVSEVFCTDFKTGSDQQALITDACILFSRLLQHGDTPADLAASMSSPPSMIGAIAQAVVRELAGA